MNFHQLVVWNSEIFQNQKINRYWLQFLVTIEDQWSIYDASKQELLLYSILLACHQPEFCTTKSFRAKVCFPLWRILALREKDLDEREKQLQKERQELSNDRFSSYGTTIPSDVLHLNVGGVKTSVLQRTLTSVPGSMLASRFFQGDGTRASKKTKTGTFSSTRTIRCSVTCWIISGTMPMVTMETRNTPSILPNLFTHEENSNKNISI